MHSMAPPRLLSQTSMRYGLLGSRDPRVNHCCGTASRAAVVSCGVEVSGGEVSGRVHRLSGCDLGDGGSRWRSGRGRFGSGFNLFVGRLIGRTFCLGDDRRRGIEPVVQGLEAQQHRHGKNDERQDSFFHSTQPSSLAGSRHAAPRNVPQPPAAARREAPKVCSCPSRRRSPKKLSSSGIA